MKELKDERMLADFLIQTSGTTRAGIDLCGLANQLMAIADELRGSDASPPAPTLPPPLSLSNGHDEIDGGSDNSNVAAFRSQTSSPQTQPANPPDSATVDDRRAAYAETARLIYATRRRRTTIFDNPELFGEPAWDILLDLYIAHADGKAVSVSSACIGSAAPPTTGLRWLGLLSDNNLVLREHDPEDQRRVLVRLTETGLAGMDQYFANLGLGI